MRVSGIPGCFGKPSGLREQVSSVITVLMRTDIKRSGRKNDPRLTERLLGVMLTALGQEGFDAVRLDALALAARTSKQAIYRRWPSKAVYAQEAVSWGYERIDVPAPERRSAAQDLFRLLRACQAAFSGDLGRALVRVAGNEAFAGVFRTHEEKTRFHVRQCLIATPFEQDLEVRADLVLALILQELHRLHGNAFGGPSDRGLNDRGLNDRGLETAIYLVLGLVAPRDLAPAGALPGL